MQTERNENENYKNLIFSIKASALIECIEDNTELGKAMRKLMQSQPVQTYFQPSLINKSSEEDEEAIDKDFVDPFNREGVIVRDYVFDLGDSAEPKANYDNPLEITSIELPKTSRKTKPVKSQPTIPPMFEIGERVLYTPDEKWWAEDDNLNPNIKIGNIVRFIWDSHYNEYKYYFANETETFSYIKDAYLLAVNEEEEQKIRNKLDKSNASTESKIPSPKFSRGNIVRFIDSSFDKQYYIRTTHYRSNSKSFFYAVQATDGGFVYSEGYQISEDKLELVPKETPQAHTPKAEPIVEQKSEAQDKPVKEKKTPKVSQNKAFKQTNAQPKKDSINQRQATKKRESSMFRDFEEEFDFLCSSHTLDSLQKIQKDIESGFSLKNRKTSEESQSKAFYDIFQYKLNNSRLQARKPNGYESIYKYAKFKKWDTSSIIETKTLTSFDYEIIDKTKGKIEANKNCDEKSFYKTLYYNGFIRTRRESKLISGVEKLAKDEEFKTRKLSLNYTVKSKEIYDLKPNALKEIFLLSLNSKIKVLIKEETKKSEMIKNISSTYTKTNLKRIDRLETLVTQGLKKHGIDFKDLVKRWLSISDVNDKISQNDFFKFLDKILPEEIRVKGYYFKDDEKSILKVPAPLFKYELFKRVVFQAPQPKQKVTVKKQNK